MGTDAVQELRGLGKGCPPLKDAAPRHLPADEEIVGLIDGLPSGWQGVTSGDSENRSGDMVTQKPPAGPGADGHIPVSWSVGPGAQKQKGRNWVRQAA